MPPLLHAPEIALPGLTWHNVAAPLSLERLRGRLVILDFWTFCCINCIQVIPTLKAVEERFPEQVAVIGVHSPKFAAEQDDAKLRQAIARYGLRHPVVQDPQMTIWRRYAVRAWPTLVFISPQGRILGQVSGEPDPDALLEYVAQAVAGVDPATLPDLGVSPLPTGGGRLSHPGKIKRFPCGSAYKRWLIADAGHHQLALVGDDGSELARFGSGEAGFRDGALAEARFHYPQGLAADCESIYVADTFNHVIRRIDLVDNRVETLAGTGERGVALGEGPSPGRETALASVWDLELDPGGRRLYFANAGSHQLGELDLDTGAVRRLAGNGRENIVDGPAPRAQLAQPSGLALDPGGQRLYFVDSETSALRVLALEEAEVTTLVGQGLFDFGHVNGELAQARLQHPLGLAVVGDSLVVADSYNDTLRFVDPLAGRVSDWGGGGRWRCLDPACIPLGEPAGVVADGPGRLLVADTNNHRIVEYRVAECSHRTWFQ